MSANRPQHLVEIVKALGAVSESKNCDLKCVCAAFIENCMVRIRELHLLAEKTNNIANSASILTKVESLMNNKAHLNRSVALALSNNLDTGKHGVKAMSCLLTILGEKVLTSLIKRAGIKYDPLNSVLEKINRQVLETVSETKSELDAKNPSSSAKKAVEKNPAYMKGDKPLGE